jgi:hypothetical protein
MTIGYLDNVKNALKVGTRSATAGASGQTKQPVSSSSSTPAVEVTP